jgi:glutamyl-tRNA synthetase
LHDLREQGYLPAALRNYLVRLGHTCGTDAWLEAHAMPAHFDLGRVSHSPARFDEAQLRHWQREAIVHSTTAELIEWLGSRLAPLGSAERMAEFVAAVRGNLMFPTDADALVRAVCEELAPPDDEALAAMSGAGGAFFSTAASEWSSHGGDIKAWTRAVGSATGRKGAALYMPLRAALTGATHGPELASLVGLIGSRRVEARLAAAAAIAAGAN